MSLEFRGGLPPNNHISADLPEAYVSHSLTLQEDSESDSVKTERARARAHRDRLAQMAQERRQLKAQLQQGVSSRALGGAASPYPAPGSIGGVLNMGDPRGTGNTGGLPAPVSLLMPPTSANGPLRIHRLRAHEFMDPYAAYAAGYGSGGGGSNYPPESAYASIQGLVNPDNQQYLQQQQSHVRGAPGWTHRPDVMMDLNLVGVATVSPDRSAALPADYYTSYGRQVPPRGVPQTTVQAPGGGGNANASKLNNQQTDSMGPSGPEPFLACRPLSACSVISPFSVGGVADHAAPSEWGASGSTQAPSHLKAQFQPREGSPSPGGGGPALGGTHSPGSVANLGGATSTGGGAAASGLVRAVSNGVGGSTAAPGTARGGSFSQDSAESMDGRVPVTPATGDSGGLLT